MEWMQRVYKIQLSDIQYIWQGCEFDNRFFERIARFLWSKEWFAHEKERITPVAFCLKIAGVDSLTVVLLYKIDRSDSCSQLLFCNEWRERIVPVVLYNRATERKAMGAICSFVIRIGKTVKIRQKHKKNTFFRANRSFLRAIRSNHE